MYGQCIRQMHTASPQTKPETLYTMKPNLSRHAFSLVELLIVVLIIGIVAGFAVPAVQGMLRGSQMSQASGQMVDTMALARQTALSKNRIIEVRIYRFADNEIPGEDPAKPETGHFRAFQTFEISESGVLLPVSKVVRLPDSIIMNPGIPGSGMLSTMLGDQRKIVMSSELDKKTDPEIARGVGHKYDYVSFRFLPDGSTNLPPTGTQGSGDKDKTPSDGGLWYITIHSINDWEKLKTGDNLKPPPNYFTWLIDPLTGTSKTFRPGLSK